jgi:hypothetical protein
MKHGKYWLILNIREQEWDSTIIDRLDEYGKIQRDLWYDSNTLVEIIYRNSDDDSISNTLSSQTI